MSNAFVLMTALPPTKGHRALIEFAATLADHVKVILCTQPDEPFTYERNWAVNQMCAETAPGRIQLMLIHKPLPQEPEGNEGFWDMWTGFLNDFGFQPGDTIVASESYGKALADYAGGKFMPFDVYREISPYKATNVRRDTDVYFDWIDHTFQPTLRKTITVFGAESTGKSTLTNDLCAVLTSAWPVFEYARPYLETARDLDELAMHDIWQGQKALQDYAQQRLFDRSYIIQDTDLFSTVGYWNMSEWAQYNISPGAPKQLIDDAQARASDLYLVTQSVIPFEVDPLRYGGDHREISDARWIDLLDQHQLRYTVLQSSDRKERMEEAREIIEHLFDDTACLLTNYLRQGSEYLTA